MRGVYNMPKQISTLLKCITTILVITAGAAIAGCGHNAADTSEQQGKEKLLKADSIFNSGRYNEALNLYYELLRECSPGGKTPDDSLLFQAHNSIGKIHMVFGDPIAALQEYKRADAMSDSVKSTMDRIRLATRIVQAFTATGSIDSAKLYNSRLLDDELGNHSDRSFFHALDNVYISFADKNDSYHTLALIDSTLTLIRKEKQDPNYEIYLRSIAALVYDRLGKNDSVISNLKRFERLAEAEGSNYLRVNCYRNLMRTFTADGNNEQALLYQQKFFNLNDSLNTTEYFRVANGQNAYERGRDRKIISEMQITISKHKLVLIVGISLLCIAIGVLGFIIWRNKILRNNYRALAERNKELVEIENRYRELKKTATASANKTESEGEEGRAADESENSPRSKNTEELAEKILHVMENPDIFCDPDFSLNRMADIIGSNTKYVSQAINQEFGMNFRSFLNDYRIKEARRRITDKEHYGNYTIQGIAESVGIKSASSFIASFKRLTGVTPSIYQKMILTPPED